MSRLEDLLAARLAKAAPDLLAACELTLEISQHADGCGWFDIPMRELNDSEASERRQRDACTCHLKKCREAIAKAK